MSLNFYSCSAVSSLLLGALHDHPTATEDPNHQGLLHTTPGDPDPIVTGADGLDVVVVCVIG